MKVILAERVYSLRSRGDFDVSALAEERGGGGHQAAAGFAVCLRWGLDGYGKN